MSLVIFDCDGVLLDSELLADQVVLEYCGEQFPEVDFSAWLERMTGLTITVILSEMAQHHQIQFEPDAEQKILALLDRRLRNEVQPIPGVKDALQLIETTKAVVSNSHSDYLNSLLGQVDILRFFGGRIFGADLVERGKPDPSLYLLAARTERVDASQCLVIEDSVPGVTAAVAAGMYTLGFVGGGHAFPGMADNLLAAGANKVIDDMRALPALVAQWSQ